MNKEDCDVWLPSKQKEDDYNDRYDKAEKQLEYLQKESKNVCYYEELEDYIRPNPDMYIPEEWNFYYFKILNKEGLEELKELYKYSSGDKLHLLDSDVGKIICIEHPEWNLLDLYYKTWDEITRHLTEIYKVFGLKMTVKKEA